MFDVITFGSATKDIFLHSKESVVIDGDNFLTKKGICFSLGSKIKVDDIFFTSGGGGTNSAVTFAKQGFNTAYCGKIGKDSAGEAVLKELEHYEVNRDLISQTTKKPTNHSIVIDVPNKDRTILVYRGASDLHSKEDIFFERLNARWFYLAPFATNACDFFYDLIDFAKLKEVKIMVNPSKSQIREEKIKNSLKNVDILLLNMEEASLLTQIDYSNEEEILKKVPSLGPKIVLITKGVKGAIAYFENKFYTGTPSNLDAVDRTGAGDSFGAGFLSEFIKTGCVKEALQFGIANSTSCVQKMGAKHGLLNTNSNFTKPEIEEFKLY